MKITYGKLIKIAQAPRRREVHREILRMVHVVLGFGLVHRPANVFADA